MLPIACQGVTFTSAVKALGWFTRKSVPQAMGRETFSEINLLLTHTALLSAQEAAYP